MTEAQKIPEIFRPDEPDETARRIPLSDGSKFAIVDQQDYEALAKHRWGLGGPANNPYAVRTQAGRTILMHREIIEIPTGMVCNHINHNRLDNRRCNLRAVTYPQNGWNALPRNDGTSRYKGVCWNSTTRRWHAGICHLGRVIYIGSYKFEEDAAIAYDDMAMRLFGEFAALNCQWRPELKATLKQCMLF